MAAIELLLVAAAAILALAPLRRLARGASRFRRWPEWLTASTAGAAAVAALLAPSPPPAEGVHVQPESLGYVSSGACRSCHADEYATWYASYHRTMTQIASNDSVQAPWHGVLEWRGERYRLFRDGDERWVELPQGAGEPQPRTRRILMTTGSHHYQAYWIEGTRGNELLQFPFVYHLETQRFIPRHDAFLQPEDDPVHTARWNSNCIQCHSVAGQPRHDIATDRFDTRAVELGIACEACHGPAGAHVARHQNPVRRYAARLTEEADPTIVNPARLDAERASEVCAQCHAYFIPRDPGEWWEAGFTRSYRPGGALDPARVLLQPGHDDVAASISAELKSVFYADGTVRVGGREWNGLSASACFTRGRGTDRISCLSCHDLHGGTRADQLPAGESEDRACAGCHRRQARDVSAHSHHAEGSSGSECVNCHMPHTSYALFKSIRSHRITSPDAALEPGSAPNACNLCHQDQSLEWTSRWLHAWYGEVSEPGSVEHAATAAAAAGLLSGDAAVRVIFADRMAWKEARDASGQQFQAQLLAEALDDPYAAVRFVAYRSLRAFPGLEDFSYDFIAERGVRLKQQAEARALARRSAKLGAPGVAGPAALPLGADGLVRSELIQDLIEQRDERPIRISE